MQSTDVGKAHVHRRSKLSGTFCGVVLSFVLLTGCATATDYPAALSTRLQATVQLVTQLSSEGEYRAALAALESLRTELAAASGNGTLTAQHAKEIKAAIAAVEEELESLIKKKQQADKKQTPTPDASIVPQPAPEVPVVPAPAPEVPAPAPSTHAPHPDQSTPEQTTPVQKPKPAEPAQPPETIQPPSPPASEAPVPGPPSGEPGQGSPGRPSSAPAADGGSSGTGQETP